MLEVVEDSAGVPSMASMPGEDRRGRGCKGRSCWAE